MRGLVLEGGGVKGSYQIGSYYAFLKCHKRIDGFVGTSIGSFNAAMLASGNYKELLKIWYQENPGMFLGLNENIIEGFNGQELDYNIVFNELKTVIKNLGVDNEGLMKKVNESLNYEKLKNSKKDFGLVTVRVTRKGLKPVYKYIEDINSQEELCEYIMASCYFPGFKEKRMIDNHYYLDGGFYDNSPVMLLLNKGYDEIYVVNVKGIGFHRKVKKTKAKIINIKASRDTGRIFELNRKIIRDNIMMGYYDTLRVLKGLDGYKYCFKKKNDNYYKYLCRNVDKRLLKRVSNFFDVFTYREIVIKALEYAMVKEKYNYYDIYKVSKVLKRIPENKHFVYRFIKELKLFF